MNIVTFAEHLQMSMEKSAGAEQLTFEAGKDYIVPQSIFNRMIADEGTRQRLYKWSRIENRIPNFIATMKKPGPQRLLFYNGSGGYGDQIMSWPFCAILTAYGYDVHVLTDPGNASCWWNFPWIKAVHRFPMQYEEFKMFNYYTLFETVVNAEEHADQVHPLDQMLLKVGIQPESVNKKLTVTRPNFTFLEMQAARVFDGRKIGMYQLAAANPVRCLPPNDSAYLLSKVADAFPDTHWLALYDKFIPEPYPNAVKCPKCNGAGKLVVQAEPKVSLIDVGTRTPDEVNKIVGEKLAEPTTRNELCPKCRGSGGLRPNVQLYNQPILRELWAATTKASVVIGPDSMMVHIAGAMDVPCIGLWGPCNPVNRTKYYKNHHPIWKKEVCQFSPCFAYAGTFPRYCPPRPNRNVCECLGAISHEEVIAEIKKIIPNVNDTKSAVPAQVAGANQPQVSAHQPG